MSFVWIQGTILANPPEEFSGFFGSPPNYTFIEADNMTGKELFTMRDFPKGNGTPEDTIRLALKMCGHPSYSGITSLMNRLIPILDSESDIEGVIGYSEGAMIAGSLILEELRRQKEYGRTPRIKCAVFLSGWPAIDPSSCRPLLADEAAELIDIPTCHAIGAEDPYIDASMALYDLCEPDKAVLFDHGGGHILPRGRTTVQELVENIREMVRSIENGKRTG